MIKLSITLASLPWTILSAAVAALAPDPFANVYAQRQINA